jgi:hypothetical protein
VINVAVGNSVEVLVGSGTGSRVSVEEGRITTDGVAVADAVGLGEEVLVGVGLGWKVDVGVGFIAVADGAGFDEHSSPGKKHRLEYSGRVLPRSASIAGRTGPILMYSYGE